MPPRGECRDWLVHDERHRRVRVAPPGLPRRRSRLASATGDSRRPPGRRCWKSSWTRGENTRFACSWPLAAIPSSAIGNTGASGRFAAGIALHARRLAITHPVRGEPLAFEAPLPRSWAAFGLHG